MTSRRRVLSFPLLAALAGGLAVAASPGTPVYDVRAFGAKGDGRTVDTAAINAAIEAAATAGGGTVYLSASTYPSYSIHLKSHVSVHLGPGATPLSNCVFDRSRGLALETVDGGDVEDVTVTNLTMRDVTTAPLFLRIGNRGRTPGDPPPGRMRRITISNVVASGVDPRYPALIAGLAGHPVEDVDLSHIRIVYRGGGTREDAAREPPENETAYPEPSMFGTLPAYGFYLRHVRNVTLRDVEVGFAVEDLRPPFALHDVTEVHFDHVRGRLASGVPFALLRDVRGLSGHDSPGLPETRRERVEEEDLTP